MDGQKEEASRVMSNAEQRLQHTYAAMEDDELLDLVRAKSELTELALKAAEAEMKVRGLAMPEDELSAQSGESEPQLKSEPPLHNAEDDVALVELMTFQIATDAKTALDALDDQGIAVRMEPAMRRLTEDGPKIKTNWLTIFVERSRHEDAVRVLRERMGLFPLLAVQGAEHDQGDAGDEDEALFPVGEFELLADAEIAQTALANAGIWFKVDTGTEDDPSHEAAAWDGASIMVRLDDLEAALQIVEAAFQES